MIKKKEKTREYQSKMAKAIVRLYEKDAEDESMPPLVLYSEEGKPLGRFCDGDYIIFYNIRGEREIELSQSLVDADFDKFPVEKMSLNLATMIEYDPGLHAQIAFPRLGTVQNTLSEIISNAGKTQAKITESEKKVHVTFFLNGKNQEPFPGEDIFIIDSPRPDKIDTTPEMSVKKVSKKVRDLLKAKRHDLIVANLCNIDVIGHTENVYAIQKAIKAVDTELGDIVNMGQKSDYRVLITADHGTVEDYYYADGSINTGHTLSNVPFIFIDEECKGKTECKEEGFLIDIAPTILALLGIGQPLEMTGSSMFCKNVPKDIKPVLLLILDGWGYRPGEKGNLIDQTATPNMDRYMSEYPCSNLRAAGESVGLPAGNVGNSEAGHLHIGAGRIIPADRKRIDDSITNGSFFKNRAFTWAMQGAKKDNKSLHLLGIVSFYSSHGSIKHLFALMDMAKKKGLENVYIHAMLGRRGEKPESGAIYVEKVAEYARKIGCGQIVSVIGRKWSLDREQHWDRIEKTYHLLIHGKGEKVTSTSKKVKGKSGKENNENK